MYICLPYHNITHLLKDDVLKGMPRNIALKKARKLVAHCFILPSFYCRQLWHPQLQQVHYQISSLAIMKIMFCHRLEKVQEVVVVLCTTKPGVGGCFALEEDSMVIL